MRRRDRDEDDQPREDERERDDLEDCEVEDVHSVVGDHRTHLEEQCDGREPDEGSRHAHRVPRGADAEQRECGGRAECEGVVQVGRLRDRHPADAHEPEPDESDQRADHRASTAPDAETAERDSPGEHRRHAGDPSARGRHRDVEAHRGEVARRAQGAEVVHPPLARRRDAHARETACGQKHGDEVEGAVRLALDGLAVQPPGAHPDRDRQRRAHREVAAGHGFERVGREVHGERRERRPSETVGSGTTHRPRRGKTQLRESRQAGARCRRDDEGGTDDRAAGESGCDPQVVDAVRGGRTLESRGDRTVEDHRHSACDEQRVHSAHQRTEAIESPIDRVAGSRTGVRARAASRP
ncbi:hypothetical protein [Agromyces humatus]|uniref:hypothetical protein n=1 Tax=Agromyces humatus TaxID=279573 RepID=UPI0027E1318A|nr:hypothetical protein [Agromyces humatus]